MTIPPPTPTTQSLRFNPIRAKPRQSVLDGCQRLVSLAIADGEHLERNAGIDLERNAGLGDDGDPRARRAGSIAASSDRAPRPTSTS